MLRMMSEKLDRHVEGGMAMYWYKDRATVPEPVGMHHCAE